MIFDITKEEFSRKVEDTVKKYKYSYIDAVIHNLELASIDSSIAAKLLTKPLIEKIEKEGLEINLIRKPKNRLPFS
jgi:hypothetical protein